MHLFIVKICPKIENIVAIKEASGNLSQVAEIAHLCGDNLHIYSGNDVFLCDFGYF